MTLIAMSGHSVSDTRQRAEQAGFDDLLVMPIGMHSLLKQLQGLP